MAKNYDTSKYSEHQSHIEQLRSTIINNITQNITDFPEIQIPEAHESIYTFLTHIVAALQGKGVYSPETQAALNNLSYAKLQTLKKGVDNLLIALKDPTINNKAFHIEVISKHMYYYWHTACLGGSAQPLETYLNLGYFVRQYWVIYELDQNYVGFQWLS